MTLKGFFTYFGWLEQNVHQQKFSKMVFFSGDFKVMNSKSQGG